MKLLNDHQLAARIDYLVKTGQAKDVRTCVGVSARAYARQGYKLCRFCAAWTSIEGVEEAFIAKVNVVMNAN
jgi:hypothetical protein